MPVATGRSAICVLPKWCVSLTNVRAEVFDPGSTPIESELTAPADRLTSRGGTQTPKARELWTYRMVDFARVANDIGALGLRVERAADFAGALREALAAGRPALIDVVTDIEAIAPAAVSS